MLTYQVKRRAFRSDGDKFKLPADVEIRFHLQPLQPFGMDAGGGRTLVQGVAARLLFDANSGKLISISEQPLGPLNVHIESPLQTVSLQGNVLQIRQRFEDLVALDDMIHGVYFVIPMLLNVDFADPPYVERVDGLIGPVPFRWELAGMQGASFVTTQERQEEAIVKCWERLNMAPDSKKRRLMAALHYFHVACRLARCGDTPGEFLAEVILNLSKTLEVLFPPSGDGRSRDAVRNGLLSLGYETEEIDGDFIPVMALRNEIDVGHVELAVFSTSQLQVLHAYVEQTEDIFRKMLSKLLQELEAGQIEVAQHQLKKPSKEALKIIERMRKVANDREKQESDNKHA